MSFDKYSVFFITFSTNFRPTRSDELRAAMQLFREKNAEIWNDREQIARVFRLRASEVGSAQLGEVSAEIGGTRHHLHFHYTVVVRTRNGISLRDSCPPAELNDIYADFYQEAARRLSIAPRRGNGYTNVRLLREQSRVLNYNAKSRADRRDNRLDLEGVDIEFA